jgi:putative heme iron utilization protein
MTATPQTAAAIFATRIQSLTPGQLADVLFATARDRNVDASRVFRAAYDRLYEVVGQERADLVWDEAMRAAAEGGAA